MATLFVQSITGRPAAQHLSSRWCERANLGADGV